VIFVPGVHSGTLSTPDADHDFCSAVEFLQQWRRRWIVILVGRRWGILIVVRGRRRILVFQRRWRGRIVFFKWRRRWFVLVQWRWLGFILVQWLKIKTQQRSRRDSTRLRNVLRQERTTIRVLKNFEMARKQKFKLPLMCLSWKRFARRYSE
jgi:hypothetical protein